MLTITIGSSKRGRNLNKEKVGNFSVQRPVMRSHSQALINLVTEPVVAGKDGSNDKLDVSSNTTSSVIKQQKPGCGLTADMREIRRLLEAHFVGGRQPKDHDGGTTGNIQIHPTSWKGGRRSNWGQPGFQSIPGWNSQPMMARRIC